MIGEFLRANADWILLASGVGFAASLLPTVVSQGRRRASTIALSTSLSSSLLLVPIELVSAAQGWWYAFAANAATLSLWGVLAWQRRRFRRTEAEGGRMAGGLVDRHPRHGKHTDEMGGGRIEDYDGAGPVRLLAVPDSTNIWDVGYLPSEQKMFVRFKASAETVYVYGEVPVGVFVEFACSESMGKYFAAFVKNKYEFTKVAYEE